MMRIRLLGTSAGGGFPQWNCNCLTCSAARAHPANAERRSQSGVAISAEGQKWFLLNASPDLGAQIESFPSLRSEFQLRGSNIEGVLLTNADLDHVLGLFILREGGRLIIHATPQVRAALTISLGVERVLQRFCGVEWRELPGDASPLCDHAGAPAGIRYAAFAVPGKPPRYHCAAASQGDVVGYEMVDDASGRRMVFLPDLAVIDETLRGRLTDCDLLLIDGTFWSESEMRDHGIEGAPTASEMGHLPVSGPNGSLRQIASLPIARKVYVHINNTNPMLLSDSPQRREVESAGVEIGRDGMEFEL